MFNIYVDSEFRERGEITINVHLEIASLFFFHYSLQSTKIYFDG